MTHPDTRQIQSNFPQIAKPAQRALKQAGFEYLEQLANTSEKELLALHGMGPKAVRILKDALRTKGLSSLK